MNSNFVKLYQSFCLRYFFVDKNCVQIFHIWQANQFVDFVLKWSNSTTLKLGLFICSQVPKNSSVYRVLIQFLIISAARLSLYFCVCHIGKRNVISLFHRYNRNFRVLYIDFWHNSAKLWKIFLGAGFSEILCFRLHKREIVSPIPTITSTEFHSRLLNAILKNGWNNKTNARRWMFPFACFVGFGLFYHRKTLLHSRFSGILMLAGLWGIVRGVNSFGYIQCVINKFSVHIKWEC